MSKIQVEVIDYYVDRYGNKIDNPEDDDHSDAVFKTIWVDVPSKSEMRKIMKKINKIPIGDD